MLAFSASIRDVFNVCYGSRLVSRVLAPLFSAEVSSEKEFYQAGREIPFERLLKPDQKLAVRTHLKDSFLTNSLYGSQLLKDAIVDRIRDVAGRRPAVDLREPDLIFDCRLYGNRMVVSLDLAGEPLHRRKYRQRQLQASLKENLAAALLFWSNWGPEVPLADILCGSGTILTEAILMGLNIPPGYLRGRFGFFSLPEYEPAVFSSLRKEWAGKRGDRPPKLFASDSDPQALSALKANLKGLPFEYSIEVRKSDFRDLEGFHEHLIISNPPYGERMGDGSDLEPVYRELGNFFKRRCAGSTAWLLVGNMELIKKIGLHASRRIKVFNGPLECRFLKFELYEKSKPERKGESAAEQ